MIKFPVDRLYFVFLMYMGKLSFIELYGLSVAAIRLSHHSVVAFAIYYHSHSSTCSMYSPLIVVLMFGPSTDIDKLVVFDVSILLLIFFNYSFIAMDCSKLWIHDTKNISTPH